MAKMFTAFLGLIISFNIFSQDTSTDSLIAESFIGKTAPSAFVTTIDGKTYKLGEDSNNIYVLNFWFIACGPCRLELPQLIKLSNEFKSDSSVHFLAISNIDKKAALEYVRLKAGLTYELVEQAQQTADLFKISYYPVNIIIDRSGKIVFYRIGYHEDIFEKMKQAIELVNLSIR